MVNPALPRRTAAFEGNMKLFATTFALTLITAILPGFSLGQVRIDKSHVPADFASIIKFAPPGWKVEDQAAAH